MPGLIVLRGAEDADLPWVHALNTVHEKLLSPMTYGAMAQHLDRAVWARVVEPDAAFLIAFDQDTAYDSVHFQWFRARFDHFLYVDRVAVAEARQGSGLAHRLYDDLLRFARQAGYPMIAAEVNADPPNEPSLTFHARRGFQRVGEEWIEAQKKTVRYVGLDVMP